ncbi:MAG: hypothetical protein IIC51_05360 [Planctomycetes bacterium]|nr:hypothetical protein [Planctomycetota bacterium]
MGNDQAKVTHFINDDGFLRRVSSAGSVKNGVVDQKAFEPRQDEKALSFTFQNESLQSDDAIRQYQLDIEVKSGDLLGIFMLTFGDLTVKLEPPLPPRRTPDRSDAKYGGLHCSTDLPGNKDHREKMALLATDRIATDRGVNLEFVPKRKRFDSQSSFRI